MAKKRYTVVGGNPFCGHTGTMSFTGLRVVSNVETFAEATRDAKENFDKCGGLMLVLYDGNELEYDEDGYAVKPEGAK